MAAKQRTTSSRKTKQHTPIAYVIDVSVGLDGTFRYSTPGFPDASSIRVCNGDTLSWSAKLGGAPVSFQVEFPGFNPVGVVGQVVRSIFPATKPLTVALPSIYHGNLVFPYTVTVANGWHDDPVVVPVPSDGFIQVDSERVISLSIDNTGNLVLDDPNASLSKGLVTWQWAGKALDDFSLTFQTPPAGWPSPTSSQSQQIALDLEKTGYSPYTIQTLNLGLATNGATLTIS
jgi:hypothetical protein